MAFWKPIDTAPKDRVIEVRGEAGPYGITSWTGRAKWGRPINWPESAATWLAEGGGVLVLAGYTPTEWR